MRNARRLLPFSLMLLAAPVLAADVGRVLLAAGDTVAIRGGQTVRLAFGSAVEDKDVLRTGQASSLQVRFTDEGLMSMRENSELRIEDYRYSGKADGSERAFLRLLKGGLRAVTGLIGRVNHDNYSLGSITATIGVRGTDFSATLCQQNCRNDDGTLAKDGLYGRVLGMSSGTNSIIVKNDAGERLFGINENFYVANANTAPQPLLEPPGFVFNRLESRKQGGTSATASGGTGNEQASTGGANQESRVATPPPPPPPQLQFIATQNQTSSGQPAVVSAITPTTAFAISFFDTVDGALVSGGGQFTRVINGGGLEILTGFTNVPTCGASSCGTVTGSTTAASVTDVGFGSAVNAHWGRWTSGTITDSTTGTSIVGSAGVGDFHYIYADLTPLSVIAAKTGVFSFSRIGGTTPTDQNGNVASGFSFSPVSVDFTNRTLNFTGMSWSIAGVTHSFSNVSGMLRPNDSAPANTVMVFEASQTNPSGCSGGACSTSSPATVNITGSFAGTTGNHLGATFATTTAPPLSPPIRTNSAQVFFCSTC